MEAIPFLGGPPLGMTMTTVTFLGDDFLVAI